MAMAGSLWLLLDDMATLLDDVGTLTQVAARKTAGVLGDDLALNAQQVAGLRAERELPVVWAVANGSLVNKLILVPLALGLSAFAPWVILPLLVAGGVYLCFEGVEKLVHSSAPDAADHAHQQALAQALHDPGADLAALERDKIRGAIRTDFVLSSEIVVIALGAVQASPWATQAGVLATVALAMTLGVYGLVAAIVKLDDLGLWLARRPGTAAAALGRALLVLAPWLLKALAVVGTLAMFLVGGGILAHGWHSVGHLLEGWSQALGETPAPLLLALLQSALGVAAGALTLGVVAGLRRLVGAAKR
jgi:hypothetical protein